MKQRLLNHLEKHGIKANNVYDRDGNEISVKDLSDGTEYYININSTRTEKGRDSFLKALDITLPLLTVDDNADIFIDEPVNTELDVLTALTSVISVEPVEVPVKKPIKKVTRKRATKKVK